MKESRPDSIGRSFTLAVSSIKAGTLDTLEVVEIPALSAWAHKVMEDIVRNKRIAGS